MAATGRQVHTVPDEDLMYILDRVVFEDLAHLGYIRVADVRVRFHVSPFIFSFKMINDYLWFLN